MFNLRFAVPHDDLLQADMTLPASPQHTPRPRPPHTLRTHARTLNRMPDFIIFCDYLHLIPTSNTNLNLQLTHAHMRVQNPTYHIPTPRPKDPRPRTKTEPTCIHGTPLPLLYLPPLRCTTFRSTWIYTHTCLLAYIFLLLPLAPPPLAAMCF